MRIFLSIVTLLLLINLNACSKQQLYGIGQGWQRNQCFKIDDAQERSRCLDEASIPYHRYDQRTKDTK